MDSTDMYRLQCIKPDLLANVDASHVVDYLIEKQVLDPEDDEQIKAENTPKRRTETLIQILPGTTPDALKHLRGALLQHHGFIVERLDAVKVPATRTTYTTTAGAGGLRTAAAAAKKLTNQQFPTDGGNITNTYNIRGDDNFVIVGGNNTKINIR